MSRVVRIVQVMRAINNLEPEPEPIAINGEIKSITFEFDADGKVVNKSAESLYSDKRPVTRIPWSWRDAQSLLSTGDWIIVADRDTTADIPKGGEELEGGAW